MHALIIGGSGRTGQLVVEELLQRGHTVTALVRNPTESGLEREGVQIVKGTPTEKVDIRAAFTARTPNVVIVTLNARRASESIFAPVISPPRMMADANANVVAMMKEFGVPKIVIMQAFGVGESWPNMHFVLRLVMKKSNMIYQYNDHNLVDKEVRSSGVVYVLARPVRLDEGQARPVKEWPAAGRGVPMMATVARSSVASWLVDAAESSRWDQSAPVISN